MQRDVKDLVECEMNNPSRYLTAFKDYTEIISNWEFERCRYFSSLLYGKRLYYSYGDGERMWVFTRNSMRKAVNARLDEIQSKHSLYQNEEEKMVVLTEIRLTRISRSV